MFSQCRRNKRVAAAAYDSSTGLGILCRHNQDMCLSLEPPRRQTTPAASPPTRHFRRRRRPTTTTTPSQPPYDACQHSGGDQTAGDRCGTAASSRHRRC